MIFVDCVFANAQTMQKSFTLRGKVTGRESGFVFLYYISAGNPVSDSCQLLNGKFYFSGTLSEPVKASFTNVPMDKISSIQEYCEFYMEPASMELAITKNQFQDFQLKGSATDADRVALFRLKKSVMDSSWALSDSIKIYLQKSDLYRTQIATLQQKADLLDSTFIVHHLSSYITADLLSENINLKRIRFRSLDSLYAQMPMHIQVTQPGKAIKYEIDRQYAVGEGKKAPLFCAIRSNGDTLYLKDYKDKKFILLDFWASWCRPCRQMTPYLLDIYRKYSDRIEFISISIDQKEDAWRQAIQKDQMPWPQILQNQNNKLISPQARFINDLYYVSVLSQLVLIAPDLTIAGNYDSNSFQLFKEKLRSLFEK
jgi:thiol-disulfide isomerase/thioredoxin